MNNFEKIRYVKPIYLEFDAIFNISTGKYTNLNGTKEIECRKYCLYITDENGVYQLSKEEVLQLAKNYIILKEKVDKYNSEIENQKIK